ncbi:MAG TPA: site-specific DNA-methyltransferase [Vicinamibacterales bacterium]|nr:site-specific DNA-methyltransferase [Vicinamibacterales bacterium]
MALALVSPRAPKPVVDITIGRSRIQLFHGDCGDVLPQLAPASIGVVVTSPPYNLGIKYRSYEDDLPRAEYLAWTDRWLRAASRAMSPDASLFLNVGAKPTDPWIPLEVAQVARQCFRLQNTIHWVKSIAIDREAAGANAGLDRDVAVGHYKPINSDRFVNDCHEYIFHFTPRGRTPLDRRAVGVPYQDPSNIKRWAAAGEGLRCRGNTWFVPYETIQNRDRDRPHPASFPPKIPEQCLRLHGLDRAGLVLDPFLGLGNTAIAAAKLGLDFVGIEMDAEYLAEAKKRILAAQSSVLGLQS